MSTKLPKPIDPEKARKAREAALRRLYGMTYDQYEDLLEKQGGGCALCGKTEEQEGKKLAVDHDHKSLRVRGILCSYCNHRVVGRHTDPSLLRRIADYLETETPYLAPPKRKRSRKTRKAKRG